MSAPSGDPPGEPATPGSANDATDLVALIPAAGFARRLGELPCSKELVPLGWSRGRPAEGRPVISYLLRRLARSGIERALIVTRHEKSDIAERLGDGRDWGLFLDYLYVAPTASTVETLDSAYGAVRGASVALGYPDIVFEPADAYAHVIERRARTGADVALGLFPSDQPEASDMVELGPDGSVERFVIKQPDRGLRFTWSIAVWGPEFTEYLHRYLRRDRVHAKELYVGDVIQAATEEEMTVEAVAFDEGASVDLGTPEALAHPPDWVGRA